MREGKESLNWSIVASLCNGFELPSPVSASWTSFSLLVNGQAFWGGGGGVGKVRKGERELESVDCCVTVQWV